MSAPKTAAEKPATPPKARRLNFRFLAYLAVGAVVFCVGVHFLHARQMVRNAASLLAQADREEAEGRVSEATGYLARYLHYRPKDTEAQLKYARLLEGLADAQHSADLYEAAYFAYARVIFLEPGREEARRRRVHLAVTLNRPSEALDQIEAIPDSNQDVELLTLKGRCKAALGGVKDDQEAAAVFAGAILLGREQHRQHIAAYGHLAALLRRHLDDSTKLLDDTVWRALGAEDADPAQAHPANSANARVEDAEARRKRADRLMNRMLHENRNSYQALLWHGQYQLLAKELSLEDDYSDTERSRRSLGEARGKLAQAHKDLQKALELKPDDVEVAATMVELARHSAGLAARADELARRTRDNGDIKVAEDASKEGNKTAELARDALEKSLKTHPNASLLYRSLAELEDRSDHTDAAIACLRRGLNALPADGDLRWRLAELLIQKGDRASLNDAAAEIDRLRLAETPPGPVDYLAGRLAFSREQWRPAQRALERARSAIAGRPEWSRFQANTELYLGRSYRELGEREEEAAALRRAVTADQVSVPANVELARALTSLRDFDGALEAYKAVKRRVPEARLWIADLLVRRNLARPPKQRDWNEVAQALDEVRETPTTAGDKALLRVQLLAGQGARQVDLRDLLRDASVNHPEQVQLWIARARLAFDDKEEVEEKALGILREAATHDQIKDKIELRVARASYWAARGWPTAKKPLADLRAEADGLKRPDRAELLDAVGDAYHRLGRLAKAKQVWQQLADLQPSNLTVRLRLFDLAREAKDQAAADKALEDIRRIDSDGDDEGSLARCCRACLLIDRASRGDRRDTQALDTATTTLAELADRRPNWARVPLFQAKVDLLRPDADSPTRRAAAIEHYQRAVDLGNRDPETYHQLVQLLLKENRFAQADKVLTQMRELEVALPDLGRIQATVAAGRHDYGAALKAAQDFDLANSQNYRDQLWLGQVYQETGHPEEAEKALRRAVELAKDAPEAQLALVRFYARAKRAPEAEAVLKAARDKDPGHPPALLLAQGFQALGEANKAREWYAQAEADKPKDVPTLQAAADFYFRTGDLAAAEPLFRRVLELDKSPATVRSARRMLALILRGSPDPNKRREALELVGGLSQEAGTASGADSPEELRDRALVLALGRTHAEQRQAMTILEGLLKRHQATADDQFLLAQLAAHTPGRSQQVHDLMLTVLDSDGTDNPRYLVFFAGYLLDQDEPDSADAWVRRLEKLQKDDFATVSLKARLLKARGQQAAAVALVQQYAEKQGDAGKLPAAQLLEQIGAVKAAEQLYRKAPALVLAAFLARQKRVTEALDLCDQAWKNPPAAAVASVQALYSGPVKREDLRRVASRLETAVKDPKFVGLNSLLAMVYNLQGGFEDDRFKFKEAEKLFREVLDKQPGDAATLNNLACLVALKDHDYGEAERLIARAIDAAGEQPHLLDTRALIALHKGDAEAARQDLEVAVADSPSSTMYFHLAQAYQALNQRRPAVRALKKAKELGLEAWRVHPLEHADYEELLQTLQLD